MPPSQEIGFVPSRDPVGCAAKSASFRQERLQGRGKSGSFRRVRGNRVRSVTGSVSLPAGAVARDQLSSSAAELSTHRNQRVTQALNKGLRDALTGAKTPEQALRGAQLESVAILRPFQR